LLFPHPQKKLSKKVDDLQRQLDGKKAEGSSRTEK
jgi:hypothetical protein